MELYFFYIGDFNMVSGELKPKTMSHLSHTTSPLTLRQCKWTLYFFIQRKLTLARCQYHCYASHVCSLWKIASLWMFSSWSGGKCSEITWTKQNFTWVWGEICFHVTIGQSWFLPTNVLFRETKTPYSLHPGESLY